MCKKCPPLILLIFLQEGEWYVNVTQILQGTTYLWERRFFLEGKKIFSEGWDHTSCIYSASWGMVAQQGLCLRKRESQTLPVPSHMDMEQSHTGLLRTVYVSSVRNDCASFLKSAILTERGTAIPNIWVQCQAGNTADTDNNERKLMRLWLKITTVIKMTEGVTSPLRGSALFAFSYVAWKT